jgi:hypothetical protein
MRRRALDPTSYGFRPNPALERDDCRAHPGTSHCTKMAEFFAIRTVNSQTLHIANLYLPELVCANASTRSISTTVATPNTDLSSRSSAAALSWL